VGSDEFLIISVEDEPRLRLKFKKQLGAELI
jgi:hypothetical protein